MQQMVPWLIFCVLFLAFCTWKPLAARMFIGLFFIVMAIAVNWMLSFAAPDLFVGLGADAPLLTFYEWVFTDVVARAPQAVGIPAGVGEIVLGVLMLSKGRWAAVGLVGAIAFLPAHHAPRRVDPSQSDHGPRARLPRDQAPG
jgi:hypothetical protein